MKKLLVAIAAMFIAGAAYAASGLYKDFPQVGNSANTTCTSYGNNSVCNQYQPLGPAYLQGTEAFLADTNYSSQNPVDITIPMNLMANGFGGTTVSTTTGTTALVSVADSISTYVYAGAGAGTYTSFVLPPNPTNNQKLCLANAGSGILTLTAVAAGVNRFGNTPTITGVAPTSLPVMTAVGTAGTVTLGSNCWLYQASGVNTGVWYRVQ